MSEEYLLTQEIGELYPVLVAADGSIIDGYHRKAAKKNWKVLKVPQIKTRKDLITARIIANVARRTVEFEESEKWVNQLASELRKETVGGPIANHIATMTGMSADWVRERLQDKYKDSHAQHAAEVGNLNRAGRYPAQDIEEPIRRTIEAAQEAHREIDTIIKPRIEREFRENPKLSIPIVKHVQGILERVPVLECPHCHRSPTEIIWKCCGKSFK